MSTEYGRIKDRNGKIICVDAQGIVGRINLETPKGEVLVSLNEEMLESLLEIIQIAATQHLGWKWPYD